MSTEHLRQITKGLELERSPLYRVGEVAKFFFAKSAHWVRWRERSDAMVVGGERWMPSRSQDNGARAYDLADVEVFVRLLDAAGAIGDDDFAAALRCIEAQADLYHLVPGRYKVGSTDYALTASEVAREGEVSLDWVYRNAEDLGGLKQTWGDGSMLDVWRFPASALDLIPKLAPVRPEPQPDPVMEATK